MCRLCLFFIVLLAFAGCTFPQDPVGTGGATDSLPKSPCACEEPFYVDGKIVG